MNTEKTIKEINSRIELDNRRCLNLMKEYIQALKLAMEALRKQEAKKPIKGSINPDKTQQYSCPICGRPWWEWNFVTEYCDVCGQRIDLSDRGFAYTIDEVMAHIGIDRSTKSDFSPSDIIGIDMSTKSDFSPSDIIPNAFVGFLGKTEDGKAELAKKEIVKAFDINKSMNAGKR